MHYETLLALCRLCCCSLLLIECRDRWAATMKVTLLCLKVRVWLLTSASKAYYMTCLQHEADYAHCHVYIALSPVRITSETSSELVRSNLPGIQQCDLFKQKKK